MFIVTFHNDNTGDEQIGNYDVKCFINYKEIYLGRVEGHERKDWSDLVIQWAEQLKEEKKNVC
jgi:hypothetical protein